MSIEKNEIRKAVLNRRELLAPEEREEYSKVICKKLEKLKEYKEANIIFAYINSKSEVETRTVLLNSINKGKTVCLPHSIKHTFELEFYRIFDFKKELQIGSYGILEPVPNVERIVLPQKAELIIIPGVAFDLNLNRVGYGKGYYDKFLSSVPESIPKIALAYDFQVLEGIRAGENDIKMDMVITEKRIITV
ncbi:MAG: 5-formyltetrahydrofolate cyclo-ligase [Deltaproteobacteria bacterium]